MSLQVYKIIDKIGGKYKIQDIHQEKPNEKLYISRELQRIPDNTISHFRNIKKIIQKNTKHNKKVNNLMKENIKVNKKTAEIEIDKRLKP